METGRISVEGFNKGVIAKDPIKTGVDTHAFTVTVSDGVIIINGHEIQANPNNVLAEVGDGVIADVFGEIEITKEYPKGIVRARQGIYLGEGPVTNDIGTSRLGCFGEPDYEGQDRFEEEIAYSGSINRISSDTPGDFDNTSAEKLRRAFGLPLKYQNMNVSPPVTVTQSV